MLDAQQNLTPYLSTGEKILWQGRGRPKLFSQQSIGGFLFLGIFLFIALFVTAIFISVAASNPRNAPPAPIFLLPLLFVFIGLVIGIPLILYGRQMSNALYIITTHAAMIASESRVIGKRVTIVPLKNVPVVTLMENRDGTGTLMFGQSILPPNLRYSGSLMLDTTPAFWNIEQPLQVYQLIRKQMSEMTNY
jgi:hypothetical protein